MFDEYLSIQFSECELQLIIAYLSETQDHRYDEVRDIIIDRLQEGLDGMRMSQEEDVQ